MHAAAACAFPAEILTSRVSLACIHRFCTLWDNQFPRCFRLCIARVACVRGCCSSVSLLRGAVSPRACLCRRSSCCSGLPTERQWQARTRGPAREAGAWRGKQEREAHNSRRPGAPGQSSSDAKCACNRNAGSQPARNSHASVAWTALSLAQIRCAALAHHECAHHPLLPARALSLQS